MVARIQSVEAQVAVGKVWDWLLKIGFTVHRSWLEALVVPCLNPRCAYFEYERKVIHSTFLYYFKVSNCSMKESIVEVVSLRQLRFDKCGSGDEIDEISYWADMRWLGERSSNRTRGRTHAYLCHCVVRIFSFHVREVFGVYKLIVRDLSLFTSPWTNRCMCTLSTLRRWVLLRSFLKYGIDRCSSSSIQSLCITLVGVVRVGSYCIHRSQWLSYLAVKVSRFTSIGILGLGPPLN